MTLQVWKQSVTFQTVLLLLRSLRSSDPKPLY